MGRPTVAGAHRWRLLQEVPLGVLLSSVPSLVGPSGPYHSHPMGDVSLPITQRPRHPCASLARVGVRASGRQSCGLWET